MAKTEIENYLTHKPTCPRCCCAANQVGCTCGLDNALAAFRLATRADVKSGNAKELVFSVEKPTGGEIICTFEDILSGVGDDCPDGNVSEFRWLVCNQNLPFKMQIHKE